jgi:hypothetical protein
MAGIWNASKNWYRRNFTWRGLAVLAFFLVKEIPDDFGRKDFWGQKLPIVWRFIYGHGTFFTIIVVALIIWLDHRRIVSKRGHDLGTLKGRTLALCDELKTFQKELGKEPEIDFKSGYSPQEFTEKNLELTKRGQKMHHGFHLRGFAERAMGLWHEYGAEMRESPDLQRALLGRVDTDENLNEIVQHFHKLVKMSED